MPRVRAGDIHINYREQGRGEPLLLINGFGSSSAGWRDEFVQGLARSFRVIIFDNRGTGETDKPDEPYSIAQMADDAVGLLDALGIARAHIVGISMGGMIAQELSLRHPGHVLGLVLGCTNCGAPLSVSASEEVRDLLMIPEGMDRREAVRRGWAAGYTPEFIAANLEYLEMMLERGLVNVTPLYARDRQLEAIMAWSSGDRLAQLAVPTLVITGDRDLLVPPENSRILHERIDGSRLHVIAGAAHGFPASHPEESVRAITEFLLSVGEPAAAAGDA